MTHETALRDCVAARRTFAGLPVTCEPIDSAIAKAEAALAVTADEPVATLNVSRFRGHLENTAFQYHGDLPDGTYSLYIRPKTQTADEWLKEAERLILEYGSLRNRLATQAEPCEAAKTQLLAHLRSHPAAPEGFVLVPVEPTEAMIEAARIKWQARVKERVESGNMFSPLPNAQTRALTENYKAMIAAAGKE